MDIPKRTQLKPVILAVLADGRERRSEGIQEAVASYFELSDDELSEPAGNGHTRFQNEHAWALGILRSEHLVELVDEHDAIYRATRPGMEEARLNRVRLA